MASRGMVRNFDPNARERLPLSVAITQRFGKKL